MARYISAPSDSEQIDDSKCQVCINKDGIAVCMVSSMRCKSALQKGWFDEDRTFHSVRICRHPSARQIARSP